MQLSVLFFFRLCEIWTLKRISRKQHTFQYLFVTKGSSTSFVKQVIWDEITITERCTSHFLAEGYDESFLRHWKNNMDGRKSKPTSIRIIVPLHLYGQERNHWNYKKFEAWKSHLQIWRWSLVTFSFLLTALLLFHWSHPLFLFQLSVHTMINLLNVTRLSLLFYHYRHSIPLFEWKF